MDIIGGIVVTLFIAIVLNTILSKIKLPTIIGYILTGIVVAYIFGLHSTPLYQHELKEIAEFGIVFLMFTIGLEFSIRHLKRMRYEVFVAGTLQIVITAIIAFIISHYILAIDQNTSFVLAVAIALSSTAIVLKTFNDSGEIHRRYGQRSLGILIMQDIAVIPILLMLTFLGSTSGSSLSKLLFDTLINVALLLVVLYLIGKYLLEPFFIEVTKTKSDEIFVTSIIFLAVGASFLAHLLGFSPSLGAFLAGMLISETKFKHQAEADLIPFRDMLLGVFFITVGIQIHFETVIDYLGVIILLLIVVMSVKFAIIYGITRLNESKRVSFKTALALVQIGEFSLAIVELARDRSIMGAPYDQVMIVTIVLSMIMTPFILKNLPHIADRFIKNEATEIAPTHLPEMKNHVVLLGFSELGQSIADKLRSYGIPYLIVDNNVDIYFKAKEKNEPIIFGNVGSKDVLKQAHIESAERIMIAIDNPKKLYQSCRILQESIDTDKIFVKVHSYEGKKIIEDLNIKNIVVENEAVSQKMIQMIWES
jgi:CPA2 family monovalent cation:H+ antiporter-2